MAQKITIIVDDTGDAEIKAPPDMSDDDVLDILTAAVEATADRIMVNETAVEKEQDELELPLEHMTKKNKQYMN